MTTKNDPDQFEPRSGWMSNMLDIEAERAHRLAKEAVDRSQGPGPSQPCRRLEYRETGLGLVIETEDGVSVFGTDAESFTSRFNLLLHPGFQAPLKGCC